jgi:hypothetical protein
MVTDPPSGYLTWQQFNAAVDALCPLECKRIFGQMCSSTTPVWAFADASSVYYRNQIRQAVLDLCNFIDEYNKNNETIYFESDLTTDGEASVGTLPPFAEFESAWYYSTDRLVRFPVKQVPWEHRFEMASKEFWDRLNCDYVVLTAASSAALAMADTIAMLKSAGRQKAGAMAISPRHDQFYVFPQVTGEWILSLFWNGQKLDYAPQELVPFGEEAAQAVAWWVQAQFAKYVDRDSARAADLMRDYNMKRSNLYTRTKQKGLV